MSENLGATLSKDSWHYKIQQFTFGKKNVPNYFSLCPYFWTVMFCLVFGFWVVLPFKIPYLIGKWIVQSIIKAADNYFEKQYVAWAKGLSDYEFHIIRNAYNSRDIKKYIYVPFRVYDFPFLPDKQTARYIYIEEHGYETDTKDRVKQWNDFIQRCADAWYAKRDADYTIERDKNAAAQIKSDVRKAKYKKIYDMIERVEKKLMDKLEAGYQKSKQRGSSVLSSFGPGPMERSMAQAINDSSSKRCDEKKIPSKPLSQRKWFKFCIKATQKIVGILMWVAVVIGMIFLVGYTGRFVIWVYDVVNWTSVGLYTGAILIYICIAFAIVLLGWGLSIYVKGKINRLRNENKKPWEFYVFVLPLYYLGIGLWRFLIKPIWIYVILLCLYTPALWLIIKCKDGFVNTFGIFIEYFKGAYGDVCPGLTWEDDTTKGKN